MGSYGNPSPRSSAVELQPDSEGWNAALSALSATSNASSPNQPYLNRSDDSLNWPNAITHYSLTGTSTTWEGLPSPPHAIGAGILGLPSIPAHAQPPLPRNHSAAQLSHVSLDSFESGHAYVQRTRAPSLTGGSTAPSWHPHAHQTSPRLLGIGRTPSNSSSPQHRPIDLNQQFGISSLGVHPGKDSPWGSGSESTVGWHTPASPGNFERPPARSRSFIGMETAVGGMPPPPKFAVTSLLTSPHQRMDSVPSYDSFGQGFENHRQYRTVDCSYSEDWSEKTRYDTMIDSFRNSSESVDKRASVGVIGSASPHALGHRRSDGGLRLDTATIPGYRRTSSYSQLSSAGTLSGSEAWITSPSTSRLLPSHFQQMEGYSAAGGTYPIGATPNDYVSLSATILPPPAMSNIGSRGVPLNYNPANRASFSEQGIPQTLLAAAAAQHQQEQQHYTSLQSSSPKRLLPVSSSTDLEAMMINAMSTMNLESLESLASDQSLNTGYAHATLAYSRKPSIGVSPGLHGGSVWVPDFGSVMLPPPAIGSLEQQQQQIPTQNPSPPSPRMNGRMRRSSEEQSFAGQQQPQPTVRNRMSWAAAATQKVPGKPLSPGDMMLASDGNRPCSTETSGAPARVPGGATSSRYRDGSFSADEDAPSGKPLNRQEHRIKVQEMIVAKGYNPGPKAFNCNPSNVRCKRMLLF
ncbi:hypothetical protein BJ742DRAFT_401170 [Cladochytrium replicatum]|nr:hypothetical protein BJ742DRAFT_401170 [Cladochytrium replicatum]